MKNKVTKPLATYNMATNEITHDEVEELVWSCILDKRYKIEVVRNETGAELIIYDSEIKDEVIYRQDVTLSYGALFGPDVSDVVDWQNIAMRMVDSQQ